LSPLGSGKTTLPEGTGRYVSRVHRLGAGDAFVAFDPESRTEADAHVVVVGRDVVCDIGPLRAATVVTRGQVTLVQAVGKGDKPEQVLRDATALGAARIVLAYSARTVSRPTADDSGKQRRFRSVVVEAARQSGRGDVPALEGPLPLTDALARAAPGSVRLCLAPGATQGLAEALTGWSLTTPLDILIGPEGGFSAAELQEAAASGFVPTTLGDFVLRTETAAVAALGAIFAIGASRR
jgi:16S rRNA (uracil1498-N3)-methyltransferase